MGLNANRDRLAIDHPAFDERPVESHTPLIETISGVWLSVQIQWAER